MTTESDSLRDQIRRVYADAANTAAAGGQAMDAPADACLGTSLYDDLDGIPDSAGLASLGCGNPIEVVYVHTAESRTKHGPQRKRRANAHRQPDERCTPTQPPR